MEIRDQLDFATFQRLAPEIARALQAISIAARKSGLAPQLLELAKLRASIVNGCLFCIGFHEREGLIVGIDGDRLEALGDWRRAGLFSPEERAALAWTDAITSLQGESIAPDVRADAETHFSQAELVALTAAVGATNAWNRIAIAFHFPAEP